VADSRLDRDFEVLKSHIRDVPDYPQPGILFRDITPLLADHTSFQLAVDALASPFRGVDKVIAIESRGFILGAPVALALDAGLVPVRKAGRLPSRTIQEEYTLEYGANTLEMHDDAVSPGDRVLIVDDVLATGGTVLATTRLVERLGGEVAGISLLIELAFLEGRNRLTGFAVRSLLVY
jgi:adenine phosphoribosyltransferase